jgi:CheY-like chemotaxis protein
MKFLVVDDEAMIAESLCEFFEDEGIVSESATSGRQALSMFEHAPDFDALITDIDMPDMSGLVLARRCRQIRPNLPVVVITGYAANAFLVPEGPSAVMEKPFNPKDLAAIAAQLIRDPFPPR